MSVLLDLSMFIMFIPQSIPGFVHVYHVYSPVNTWICPCLSCLFPCQYLDLSMFIMSIPLSILIFGGCHFSDIYKGFYFEQTNSLNLKVVLINFYLFLCNWHNVILTKILIATFQYMHCLDKKKKQKKTLKAESINLYLKSHI